MTEELLTDPAAGDAALLELGIALGQNFAFGLVAGRCSAAQAEALRRLREERLYRRCAETWLEFCPKYLKMSKAEADRTIKLLEEFGPAYFELSQLDTGLSGDLSHHRTQHRGGPFCTTTAKPSS